MDQNVIDAGELALRRLPEAYSLALRLRRAGTADEVICDYLRIEPEALETLVEIAQRKLATEVGRPGSPG